MTNVVPLRPIYAAEQFSAETEVGRFVAAGTLCGHIDFVGPWGGSYPISPDEAFLIIRMLQRARMDVLDNSDPNDPRLFG